MNLIDKLCHYFKYFLAFSEYQASNWTKNLTNVFVIVSPQAEIWYKSLNRRSQSSTYPEKSIWFLGSAKFESSFCHFCNVKIPTERKSLLSFIEVYSSGNELLKLHSVCSAEHFRTKVISEKNQVFNFSDFLCEELSGKLHRKLFFFVFFAKDNKFWRKNCILRKTTMADPFYGKVRNIGVMKFFLCFLLHSATNKRNIRLKLEKAVKKA